jgi:hypothetical protein
MVRGGSMKLNKTTEYADVPVYPPLEKILTELYLKVPSLSFEAKDSERWLRDMPEPHDQAYINYVTVFNGVEEVGRVRISHRTHRGSSGRVHVYEIVSPRIHKNIGRKDCKETSKYGEALKTAVKAYSQTKSPNERGRDLWEKFHHNMNGVKYTAQRNAERFVEDYAVDMAAYFIELTKGGSPIVPSCVHRMLAKPDIEKLIDTYNIIKSVFDKFESGDGLVIVEERDGSMTEVSRNGKEFHTRRMSSSYDLPEVMQPKIGMLKMLKEKQAAESIGIRFVVDNYNWFFLCGGEIITAS